MAITPGYIQAAMPYYNQQPYNQQYFMPQQSYAQPMPTQQHQPNFQGVIYVDGENEARSTQIPAGWDVSRPLAFWDMNAPYIYVRSFNQAGMPNPLMRLKYFVDNPQQETEQQTQPQMSGSAAHGESVYATREELSKIENDMNEIRETLRQYNANQNNGMSVNGSQNGQNHGGNR